MGIQEDLFASGGSPSGDGCAIVQMVVEKGAALTGRVCYLGWKLEVIEDRRLGENSLRRLRFDWVIGILRLRMPTRLAHRHASLRMTVLLEPQSQCFFCLSEECFFRGMDAVSN